MLTVRVILSIALLVICQTAYSQESPKAPGIESKNKTKDPPPANENAKSDTKYIAPPPSIPLQSIPSIDTNKTSEDTKNSRDEASEFTVILGHRIKFTDSLLVLFTFLLFVATGLLWWSTRRLVKGAEDTAERQLRAYLSVEAQLTSLITSGDILKAKVTTRNCGQTPAYNVTQITGIAIGPTFSNIPPPEGPGGITTAAIGPGGTNEQLQSGEQLSQEAISALQHGQLTLWVYGEVNFMDAFDIKRFIKYRFMVGGPVGFHGNSMCICEEGNEQN